MRPIRLLRRRTCLAVLLLAIVLVLLPAIGFLLLDRVFPLDFSRLDGLSRVVLDRDGGRLRAYLSDDGFRRLPVALEDVDPRYLAMLVAYEDRRFWLHKGIDPLALLRAVWQAAAHRQVVSGASTLTMQAARLLEPRKRGLGAKLIEMFRALQLERRLSKNQILEIYLTLAPFGGNLEGVTAASWQYFGRPPTSLRDEEAALLVALPQSPTRRRPDFHPVEARRARDQVLDRVAAAGLLDSTELQRAKAEPLLPPRRPTGSAAPHLADRLLAGISGKTVIRSSLDGTLQRRWEGLARQWANSLGPGVSLALLAVENRNRSVLAYVGGADFHDNARAGKVDLVRAKRSPGSALKPVLYALAFERGLAHPATLVDDVPTSFGGYAPANFMQRYYGRVTLSEALRRSLNVPAVALLDRLGPVAVTERLRRAGIGLDFGDPAAVPGLALALGGVGATLEDLVKLYAALADDGRVRPLSSLAQPPLNKARMDTDSQPPLFGAAARWYLAEILRGVRPPDSLLPDRHRRQTRPLAFKTGTSYGFRDAWAIGYNGRHTVGVWVGRPDGTPTPGRFGANTAAPILFQLFDDLPPSEGGLPARPRHAHSMDAKLPPGLRLLGEDFTQSAIAAATPPPRILFPLDGTALPLPDGRPDLALEAEGGKRPLTWLVNGWPLETSSARWRAAWRPDGPGFNDIVLLDALGRRATARVRLLGP